MFYGIVLRHLKSIVTYITIAEFFIIRPHGPNCWNGDGALRLRVRLQTNRNDLITLKIHFIKEFIL